MTSFLPAPRPPSRRAHEPWAMPDWDAVSVHSSRARHVTRVQSEARVSAEFLSLRELCSRFARPSVSGALLRSRFAGALGLRELCSRLASRGTTHGFGAPAPKRGAG